MAQRFAKVTIWDAHATPRNLFTNIRLTNTPGSTASRGHTDFSASRGYATARSAESRPCRIAVKPCIVPYVCTCMGTKRFVDSALRSLVGAEPGLILTCAILILAVMCPVLTASQERAAHMEKAIQELHDGRPLPAVAHASEAVKVNPRSAEALAVLGLSQLKCGEWEKAESRFNEAIAIDSLSPEAHLGLGMIAACRMRYREAIPHLRQATSSQLFPGAAYSALASALEDLNSHREASDAIKEASKCTDDISADQQANARAFADIFAAYDGRSLHRIPENFRSTSVHFNYSEGHIIVPVVLNGSKQVDFVLDTGLGGSLMLSDDYAEGLDLTYVGEVRTISLYGGLNLKAAILDSLRIGGLEMRDVPVLVCENSPFGSIGVIGWKVIQKVNTTIDFEKSQIRFSRQAVAELHGEGVADEEMAECVPFLYLTSMFVNARFGDDLPRAFVFDTGAVASYLHSSNSNGLEDEQAGSSCSIRIGDLAFDLPQTQFLDFSAIHKKGRYYFPGVIGSDILRHSVVHILPMESMLCIEKGES
jgi:tetratricopeptide (TPR) repeat protein